ncbi:MAG: SDR family NAD(P)-dependent oxidoreductase [Fimbriimonadaceae bacterium]|nr:SDR family NAD(P)-dependent oxidoreductase [Fimbriimonadaceae bacterium]
MPKYRFAIVVGASSGIGREIARQLAQSGCRVAAVARRYDRLEELRQSFPDFIIPAEHSVTDYDAIPALFQDLTGKLGGLDLIVYASGAMPKVEENEFDFQKDRQMIEVNDLGAVAWLDQAAERFQNTKHGTIVGIGSVAGDRGRLKQPVYNASKAFLHTYLEALRNRLSRHGVKVVTVKPGPVQTEMTAGLDLPKAITAESAAAIILKKSARGGEHYLSPIHAVIFFIIRNIPSWIFRRLNV